MMSYRKYTREILEDAVLHSFSYSGVMRYLGIKASGGPTANIIRRIQEFEIDHSHFTHRGVVSQHSNKWKTSKDIFLRLPEGSQKMKSFLLRRALAEMGVPEQCNGCGLGSQWQGKFLRLEINHIDGDWLNNTFENLEYLCPNCHSQETETNKPHKNRIAE